MPTVSRPVRQVRTAAIPGVRRTAAETPESLGAGLARAEGQTAEAAANLGDVVSRLGVSTYTEIQRQERQRAHDVAMLEADNALTKWTNDRLYNPEGGALTKKGKAAQALPEEVDGDFEKTASEIGATLSTPEQRAAFEQLKLRHQIGLDTVLKRHVFAEMTAFEKQELDAKLENTVGTVSANALDPKAAVAALTDGLTALRRSAERLGYGPEELLQRETALTTRAHVGAIEQLLALGNDKAAVAYFEGFKGQIAGDAQAKIVAAIDAGTTAAEGVRSSDQIWNELGPKGESDPVNIDAMETAAREQHKDDPKVLTATLQRLRERKAGVDAGRADRKEAIAGDLWKAVAQGASLSDIQRMPQYLAAPGALQVQVSEHVVDRAEQQASRKLTGATRGEQQKEQAGWAMLWHYDDPAVLSKMTDNQVLALLPDLGVDHVNRLMQKKRAYEKSDDTVRAATIDSELFKSVAVGAGMNAYAPKTDVEKADLSQLQNTVEAAIDREQQARGKTLTRDEKEKLTRSIVDQKVYLSVWGSDRERIAALVTTPADRQAAYVPLTKIPAAPLAQYLNYARSLDPRNQGKTDQQLQAEYQDRIQRAYAIRVLGGTREEIEAIMQGRE